MQLKSGIEIMVVFRPTVDTQSTLVEAVPVLLLVYCFQRLRKRLVACSVIGAWGGHDVHHGTGDVQWMAH
jgi:hypothetical protein